MLGPTSLDEKLAAEETTESSHLSCLRLSSQVISISTCVCILFVFLYHLFEMAVLSDGSVEGLKVGKPRLGSWMIME